MSFRDVKVSDLETIKWIAESEHGKVLIQNARESRDKFVSIPSNVKLVLNLFDERENYMDVLESMVFFSGQPVNFNDYFVSLTDEESNNFIKTLIDRNEMTGIISDLKFLRFKTQENVTNDCVVDLCGDAIKVGNLDTLIWLNENGYPCRHDSLITAVRYTQLECVMYLCSIGFEVNKSVIAETVKLGNIDCLKYFDEVLPNPKDWSYEMTLAAKYGQLECLKYLDNKGHKWSQSIIVNAAHGMHLECFNYAYMRNIQLGHGPNAVSKEDLYKAFTKS